MQARHRQFDEYRNEITPEEPHSTGPSVILRTICAILTVAAIWAIYSNITNERVIFANVNGSSMDYSLLNGQHVMIDTFDQPTIERGTIIAFSANNEDPLNPRIAKATENKEAINYVKRIVGLPGETIEGREDGIYINGEKVDEPYLANKYRPITIPWTINSLTNGTLWADDKTLTVIPEDHVFVLGDNREISEDSRYFGFVAIDSIIGDVKSLPWNEQPVIEKAE